jgi:flagellar hook-associated protein FlgK
MLSTSAIALSGMNAAQTGMQVSAHNIANLNTDGFRRQQMAQASAPGGGVSVSLSQAAESGSSLEADAVDLMQQKNSFLANLSVFRSSDRMLGSLLDAVS